MAGSCKKESDCSVDAYKRNDFFASIKRTLLSLHKKVLLKHYFYNNILPSLYTKNRSDWRRGGDGGRVISQVIGLGVCVLVRSREPVKEGRSIRSPMSWRHPVPGTCANSNSSC